jgi:zinc transporter ZupT
LKILLNLVTEGFSVAISIWLGNIQQELGDFALLVRAGMTPFQALFYNYVSAMPCMN